MTHSKLFAASESKVANADLWLHLLMTKSFTTW
jgi:hypothetical protein